MATVTLVVTYTAASAGNGPAVTSMTIDGTASASATATERTAGWVGAVGALKLLQQDGKFSAGINPYSLT